MNRTALSVIALAVGAVLIIGLFNVYKPQVTNTTHDIFDKVHIGRMAGSNTFDPSKPWNSSKYKANSENERAFDFWKDQLNGPAYEEFESTGGEIDTNPQSSPSGSNNPYDNPSEVQDGTSIHSGHNYDFDFTKPYLSSLGGKSIIIFGQKDGKDRADYPHDAKPITLKKGTRYQPGGKDDEALGVDPGTVNIIK